MVLSCHISFREASAALVPADRLRQLSQAGIITSYLREGGELILIDPAYWSPTPPPEPQPDADGWLPGGRVLPWPLPEDQVVYLRAEIMKHRNDPPKSSSGPVKGQIRRYDAKRRELIPDFEAILKAEKCTQPKAARRLGDRLPGAGTLDSRAKGFLRFYRDPDRDKVGN